ncbi:MAG: hypothetical protein RL701_7516 [Pseudomonadota bacterium]
MCRRIQCEHCQKPTFNGCGKHVEQVLRGVLELERCQCRNVAIAEHGSAQQRQSTQMQAVRAE